MVLYRVVFLGDGGVGKSALIIQFVKNLFMTDYDATIENTYRKAVTLNERTDMLEIVDTAGQECYSVMRDQYIRSGQGFVLMYSVLSRSSFDQIKRLYQQICAVKELDAFPVVLAGNKADVLDCRQVYLQDGEDLVRSLGPHVRFLETSAKTRTGVDDVFNTLVRQLRDMHRISEGDPSTGLPAPAKRRCVLL